MSNQPATPAEGREMNLSRALAVIWRRKELIAAGTLLAVVGAWLFNASLPKAYRATVKVWISRPVASSSNFPDFHKTIIGYLKNSALATGALRKFKLDKPPFSLTPVPFLRQNLNVQLNRQTDFIEMTVELPDPGLAWKVANYISREGRAEFAGLLRKLQGQKIKYVEEQLNGSLVRHREAREALLSFRRKTNVSNLTDRLFHLQNRNAELGKMILRADIEANAKEAEILALEDAAKRNGRSLKIKALTDENKNSGENDAGGVLTIEAQLTRSKAEYASLKTSRETMRKNGRAIRTELDSLSPKVMRLSLTEEALRAQVDLESEESKQLAKNLNQSKEDMHITDPRIEIVDPGIIPEAPVRPRVLAWTALSGAVALSLFICLAFLMEEAAGRRTIRPERRKIDEPRMERG